MPTEKLQLDSQVVKFPHAVSDLPPVSGRKTIVLTNLPEAGLRTATF